MSSVNPRQYNWVPMYQEALRSLGAAPGLTIVQAQERLRQYGPNRVEEDRRHPLLALLSKFWVPVPWMLEATVVLEILVHKRDEAIIIGALVVFNAILSFVQESQANRALALLKSRLCWSPIGTENGTVLKFARK